jgi:hypothetical protein
MAPRKMRLIGFKLQNLVQKLKTKALPYFSIPPNSEANGDRALQRRQEMIVPLDRKSGTKFGPLGLDEGRCEWGRF